MTDELPPGWARSRLSDIAEVRLGRQRSPGRAIGEHMVPYLRAANVTWRGLDLSDVKSMDFRPSEQEIYRLVPGDILLSEASGSPGEVGKPAIWQGEIEGCCFQNTLLRVRAPTDLIRCLYFHFLGDAMQGRFGDDAKGVSINHLGAERLSRWVVRVPPLNEQQRIVEAIEEQLTRLDAAVAGLKRVQQQLRRYRASVLKAACEGRLVPTEAELARADGREYEPADRLLERILEERRGRGGTKYKEPRPPSITEFPFKPEGWTWATVEQVSSLVTDGDHNPPKRVLTGIPHLTAKNIKRWQLNLDGCTYITPSDYERTRTRFDPRPGDLIVTCVGTVGQTAVVPEGLTFSADRNLAGIRTLPGMHVRMLQIVLNAPSWEARIAGASGATAQPHLYLGDLRALPVPLPPLAEQERIVAEVERRLSVVEKAEAAVEANLKRAERMRQAILKRAFEGKLVPQDPNDEPASVLLERIQAAREQAAATESRRRGRRATAASANDESVRNGQLRLLDADEAVVARQRVIRGGRS